MYTQRQTNGKTDKYSNNSFPHKYRNLIVHYEAFLHTYCKWTVFMWRFLVF